MCRGTSNVVLNSLCCRWKQVATMALKRKKAHENELERISGTRLQLEMQVNTLESANLNAETLAVMKKGADALRVIHGNLDADKVADTMDQITEQRGIAEEISNAIASNPLASPGEDVRCFFVVGWKNLWVDLTGFRRNYLRSLMV